MQNNAATRKNTTEHIPALFTLYMSFIKSRRPFKRLVGIDSKKGFAGICFG